jgi:O-antigen/teichoic acid export membrane protein
MTSVSTIRRNSAFAALATSIRLISNGLMFILVARSYGPEAFGEFSLAHTYMMSFYLIADFGFEFYLTSEVARNRYRVRDLMLGLFSFKIVISLFATTLMCAVAFVSGFSTEVEVLMVVFSLSISATALTGFFLAMFKGLEEFQHETVVSFAQNALLLLLLASATFGQLSVVVIVWMFVGTRFVGLGMTVVKASRVLEPIRLRLSLGECKKIVVEMLPFGIFLLCGTLYFQVDTIVLAYYSSEKDIGLYQAVFKLIGVCLISGDIIVQSLLPVLSRLHEQSHDRWQRVARFAGKTLTLLGLVWSAGLFLFPVEVLHLVYGDREFTSAEPILEIFAVVLLVRFASDAYALMLTTSRRQRTRTRIVVFLTALSFVLSLIIIPRHGIIGAAWVSLVTNTIGGLAYCIIGIRETERGFNMVDLRFASAVTICLLFVCAVWLSGVRSLLVGSGLLFLPMFIVFLFLGYNAEERRLVFSLRR